MPSRSLLGNSSGEEHPAWWAEKRRPPYAVTGRPLLLLPVAGSHSSCRGSGFRYCTKSLTCANRVAGLQLLLLSSNLIQINIQKALGAVVIGILIGGIEINQTCNPFGVT